MYCVALAPNVKVCAPFSHVTLSSPRNAVALREDGVGLPLGDVSVDPTDGKVNWTPFELAKLPVNIDELYSGKKSTGAPL